MARIRVLTKNRRSNYVEGQWRNFCKSDFYILLSSLSLSLDLSATQPQAPSIFHTAPHLQTSITTDADHPNPQDQTQNVRPDIAITPRSCDAPSGLPSPGISRQQADFSLNFTAFVLRRPATTFGSQGMDLHLFFML